ncbi:MAG: hypothetical protein PHN80_06620 [Hespellia sp.]|nr:hypothetical protein [Hespellia sp.]
MVIVYLSNRYIRVIDGESSGGKLHAKKLLYTVDTQACIVNGTITDEDAFSEMISELWESNHLARKNVQLVIDSNQFTTKVVEAPNFKPKQMLEFISREFNDVERISNPVYGCFEVKEDQSGSLEEGVTEETDSNSKKSKKKKAKAKNTKTQKLFATMAPKDFLRKYIDVFEELGIEVAGIDSALGAALRLTALNPHGSRDTGIIQMVDDVTLTSFLFVDGRYQYSSRTRLFSDAGTAQYAVEIARNVSNLLQFAKAQDLAQNIPKALIAGLDEDTYAIYRDSLEQINPDMSVEEMDTGSFIQADREPAGNQKVTNFVMALGGLLTTNKKTDLMVQMAYDPEKAAQKKKRNQTLVPLMGLASVMLFAVVILAGRLVYFSIQQKELDAYNNRADVVESVEKYDAAYQQIQVMGILSNSMTNLKTGVLAYPRVDSTTENAIASSAAGLVTAQLSDYDATIGIVSLDVKADNVDRIHQFITKLSDQSIFYYVDYTGYSQDSNGTWNVEVKCTMAAREGEQDGTEAD